MASFVLPGGGKELFGGSESRQSSTPVDFTPPEIKALRGPYANILKGIFSGGKEDPLGGVPAYEGDLTAPLGTEEQFFLKRLQQLGSGAGSDTLAATARGDFVPQDGELDPFTSAAINAAIAPFQRQQEDFLRRTLPSAQLQAGQEFGPGASSAASRFGAVESADIAQRAAEAGAQIAFGQREAERGRQQEAIQLGQQEVQTTISNLQAQALPRLISELGIERGLSEFQNRMQSLLQALAVVSGSSVHIANRSEGFSESFRGELNTEVAKAAAQGAGMAAAASDVAVKRDITLLHRRDDGLGIYSFRYKGDHSWRVGVLAQEVEKLYPEAVETIDGVKHVHYDRLPEGAHLCQKE